MQPSSDHPTSATPYYFKGGKTGCVLIHGFTGTPYTLLELGKILNEQGMTVTIPLLPGHGTRVSDLIGTTWQDWLSTCREAFRTLRSGCDHVVLVGLSMGGTLALYLASESSVDGCVALSTPIDKASYSVPGFRFWRHIVRYWPKWHYLNKPYPPRLGYRWYPTPAVQSFLDLLKETRKRLHRVLCPVLLVNTVNDRRVTFDQQGILACEIGSLQIEKIELSDRRHNIAMGREKEKVFKAVLEFVNKVTGDGSAEHGLEAAPGSSDS